MLLPYYLNEEISYHINEPILVNFINESKGIQRSVLNVKYFDYNTFC